MRTKQFKFLEQLLLALFFTSFLSALNAQYIEVPLERKIQNAPFIFEGEVISSQSFMPEEQKIIYTSHIVKISKILKGDFLNDEVEIITVGGSVNGLRLDVTNNLMLRDDWEGIFFCRNTVRPSLNRSNSNLALRVYEGEQGFIRYQNHFGSTTAKTVFHHYENVETDLLSVIEQKTRKRERINPNKRERALLEWISQKSYGNTSRNGMKTGIEYEFANPEITGQNDEYFEFDIEVSTFTNTFLFGNAEIYLEYDPNVWGLNMVANGKITATKETVILSSDYSLTVGDETASKLKLAVTSINNPNNPFSLTPNKEELCHLKLDISNLLSVSPNIFFDETAMQGESEYYQNGNFIDFLNVVAADSMIQSWGAFVPPVIDSIRPLTLNAGIFDTLYIYGSNFGNSEGEVLFNDADAIINNFPSIAAETIDVDWSDNLIKVMLFSSNNNGEVPGSGKVMVIKDNLLAEFTTSNEVLKIDFALTNYRNPAGEAILPTLIDATQSDTFKFQLHESITFNSDTADAVKNILKQWRCVSGINWKLSQIPTTSKGLGDNINSFYFASATDNLIDSTALGITLVYSRDPLANLYYCNYNNNTYVYIEEVDVIFNGFDYDWFFTTNPNQSDTTKADFWTIGLHEFGHAHLFEHVNLDTSTLTPFLPIEAIYRVIDEPTKFGAEWIMDSIEVISPHCGGDITRTYQGCLTSTNKIIQENSFKLYPNPTNEYVILEYENIDKTQPYYLTIYDINGRIVHQENEQANYGHNLLYIEEVGELSQGMYFIQLRFGNQTYSSKLIKF
jgi:hypothetical protein